jgi:hypothetical protein
MASATARRLSAEQQAIVAGWVEHGREHERDGVVGWWRVDLLLRIAQEFADQPHEGTVGKLLRKRSFRRISVSPQHAQSKPEEQAVFSASSIISRPRPCRRKRPAGRWRSGSQPALGLDPGGEARVVRQGMLARVWVNAAHDSAPRASDATNGPIFLRSSPRTGLGAICPERGTGAAIIMPEVTVAAMNEPLAAISRRVSVGPIALLVLDGAGWASRRPSTSWGVP